MTTTWQQAVLAYFRPKKERMLLVIDPDNLMRDDALLADIQNNNYDVLELDDEVTFRNKFERTYRSAAAGTIMRLAIWWWLSTPPTGPATSPMIYAKKAKSSNSV